MTRSSGFRTPNCCWYGDTVVMPTPFAFGSYMSEWPVALAKMLELKPAIIIPGHGPVQRDYSYVNTLIEMFQALTAQVKEESRKGRKRSGHPQAREARRIPHSHRRRRRHARHGISRSLPEPRDRPRVPGSDRRHEAGVRALARTSSGAASPWPPSESQPASPLRSFSA